MKKFLIEFICWYVVSLFILEILTPENLKLAFNGMELKLMPGPKGRLWPLPLH